MINFEIEFSIMSNYTNQEEKTISVIWNHNGHSFPYSVYNVTPHGTIEMNSFLVIPKWESNYESHHFGHFGFHNFFISLNIR
jgi:hypothetical protein